MTNPNRPDNPTAVAMHEGRYFGGRALVVLGGPSGKSWESVRDKIKPDVILTANGNTRAYRTRIDSVGIGEIKLYDLSATILTNMPGKEILLGMNFLKHLEITQKGKTLTIKQ